MYSYFFVCWLDFLHQGNASSTRVSWLLWPGLTNKFRKINTESRDGGNCVKFCILKSVPHSTLAHAPGTAFWLVNNWPLGLRGIYITSGCGLRITGNTFLSSIENFSAYLEPSLARLYSAAASPSECLCLDGSLAISCQDNFYSLKFLGHGEKSHHSHIIHQANHQTQKTMNTWSEIFQEYLLCCDESTKIRMCKQATKPQTINLMMKA